MGFKRSEESRFQVNGFSKETDNANQGSVSKTFLFHDYETTGIHDKLDRPTQFSGIRTDENFNKIGEPINIFCQPHPDIIPHPMAVAITGITPEMCRWKGLRECDFAFSILNEMSKPYTCSVGFNNISFDDEFSRNLFYRNFHDPYAREWQHGNSRWDMLSTVRFYYALYPDGIAWPYKGEEINEKEVRKVSLKLQDLAKANSIEHTNAHDALSDVEATIGLARLLKTKNPKAMEYALSLRDKTFSLNLLKISHLTFEPLVHIENFYSYKNRYSTLVTALGPHPVLNNAYLVVRLNSDLSPLFDFSAEEIAMRLFGGATQPDGTKFKVKEKEKPPVSVITSNKSPMIVKFSDLSELQRKWLGFDGSMFYRCLENKKLLQKHPNIYQKIFNAFKIASDEFYRIQDPELMIYAGFPSSTDKNTMERIHETHVSELDLLEFEEERFNELLFRYRFKKDKTALTQEELERWNTYLKKRLITGEVPSALTLKQFFEELKKARIDPNLMTKHHLLDELEKWVRTEFEQFKEFFGS